MSGLFDFLQWVLVGVGMGGVALFGLLGRDKSKAAANKHHKKPPKLIEH